jgi:hypothetical protein
MKKYDTVIAIDPDVEKSGIAELNVKQRMLEATTLPFPLLLDYLQERRDSAEEAGISIIVVVEAGWLNAISNYHTEADRRGQRIAKNVGANHQVGKMIVEMCEHYGIPVDAVKPLRKKWKGKAGKITQEEIASFTGLVGRMNQEARDAALLAWVYAELPIRII